MRLALSFALAAQFGAGGAALAESSLTSSTEDSVAYAVGSICAPFALDRVDRSALPINHGMVRPDGHDGLAQANPTGVRVGFSGFVHVTFSESPNGRRSCDVQANGADPQALRKAALAELGKRAERFTPEKSKYLPGRFATEDMLCAAADSSKPFAMVVLSSPHPEERARIAIMFTLTDGLSRDAGCDHEGVALNYRTLAPPQ